MSVPTDVCDLPARRLGLDVSSGVPQMETVGWLGVCVQPGQILLSLIAGLRVFASKR